MRSRAPQANVTRRLRDAPGDGQFNSKLGAARRPPPDLAHPACHWKEELRPARMIQSARVCRPCNVRRRDCAPLSAAATHEVGEAEAGLSAGENASAVTFSSRSRACYHPIAACCVQRNRSAVEWLGVSLPVGFVPSPPAPPLCAVGVAVPATPRGSRLGSDLVNETRGAPRRHGEAARRVPWRAAARKLRLRRSASGTRRCGSIRW